MVKQVVFKDPEAEVESGAVAPEDNSGAKLVRIIIHTSHTGDDTNVRFFNRLYPEWGPRHLDLPRNEEVVVDSRVLPRFDGKCSLHTKVDDLGRPVRDLKTGDVVKIQKMRFPYSVLGDAEG